MARADFRRMGLPDLVNSAVLSLESAQEALTVLAERIDPSATAGSSGRVGPRAGERRGGGQDIMQSVPAWLRPLYTDFREEVLRMNDGVQSRPAPIRDGARRYEAFFLQGRNVIYAHFRKSFIKVNFELPQDHTMPKQQVVRSGERDFRVFELRSEEDLDVAKRLARETLASVTAR